MHLTNCSDKTIPLYIAIEASLGEVYKNRRYYKRFITNATFFGDFYQKKVRWLNESFENVRNLISFEMKFDKIRRKIYDGCGYNGFR